MMMHDEQLSGTGDVYVKKTRALVGRYDYELQTSVPPGRHLRHTDAWIDVDWRTAMPLLTDASLLVLCLTDGRFVDFYVTKVDPGDERVAVTVTGAIRAEW